jgi:hypothetical protein
MLILKDLSTCADFSSSGIPFQQGGPSRGIKGNQK